jgi:hypothetical protein
MQLHKMLENLLFKLLFRHHVYFFQVHQNPNNSIFSFKNELLKSDDFVHGQFQKRTAWLFVADPKICTNCVKLVFMLHSLRYKAESVLSPALPFTVVHACCG